MANTIEETCIVMIPSMLSLQLHHMQVLGDTLFITSMMAKKLIVIAVDQAESNIRARFEIADDYVFDFGGYFVQ